MSSPTIVSPLIMDVEVFPQSEGKAPARYVTRPDGPCTPIMNMCSVSQPSFDALFIAGRIANFFSPMVFPPYCVFTLYTVSFSRSIYTRRLSMFLEFIRASSSPAECTNLKNCADVPDLTNSSYPGLYNKSSEWAT